MGTLHLKLRAEAQARKEFERYMGLLGLDLAMNTPRRHLDVSVRLLELLVEQTGGNLLTEQFRVKLADLKKRVAMRGNLKLVGAR
jgi:hypothetical protein